MKFLLELLKKILELIAIFQNRNEAKSKKAEAEQKERFDKENRSLSDKYTAIDEKHGVSPDKVFGKEDTNDKKTPPEVADRLNNMF